MFYPPGGKEGRNDYNQGYNAHYLRSAKAEFLGSGFSNILVFIVHKGKIHHFRSSVKISNKRLRLKIFFSSGSDLFSMEALGEVVWVDIHLGEGWGDYKSGVKFIDILLQDMTKLKDFLKSLSQ